MIGALGLCAAGQARVWGGEFCNIQSDHRSGVWQKAGQYGWCC
jgi:hypothetical protein